jgi:hypothetical protein
VRKLCVGLVVWLSAALAVTGCSTFRKAAHAMTPQPDPPEAIRWNGVLFTRTDTLADTASNPYGTAWMAPVSSNNQVIQVRVMVARARPGTTFDWRVHIGTCAHDRGTFGPPVDFKPIVADSTGTAVGNTVLLLGFPNRGSYFVRVDAIDSGPPDGLCGTLSPPG